MEMPPVSSETNYRHGVRFLGDPEAHTNRKVLVPIGGSRYMKRRKRLSRKSSLKKQQEAIKALLSASPSHVLNYPAIYEDLWKALRRSCPTRVFSKRTR